MHRNLSVDEIRKILAPGKDKEMAEGIMPQFDCPPPHYDEVPTEEKGWNYFAKCVIGCKRTGIKHATHWKQKEIQWKRQEFLGIIPSTGFQIKKQKTKRQTVNLDFDLDRRSKAKRESFIVGRKHAFSIKDKRTSSRTKINDFELKRDSSADFNSHSPSSKRTESKSQFLKAANEKRNSVKKDHLDSRRLLMRKRKRQKSQMSKRLKRSLLRMSSQRQFPYKNTKKSQILIKRNKCKYLIKSALKRSRYSCKSRKRSNEASNCLALQNPYQNLQVKDQISAKKTTPKNFPIKLPNREDKNTTLKKQLLAKTPGLPSHRSISSIQIVKEKHRKVIEISNNVSNIRSRIHNLKTPKMKKTNFTFKQEPEITSFKHKIRLKEIEDHIETIVQKHK
ncbi:unnamed protein product [Moneuplotes crassus]|uniref:Uncharacterized protein n=1 Tax=Euplotes crassus TaxID=5936 RepID=A0AAD1U8M6_EUPCR|nr:unnamed protein product [Moneuplotes crassus]